MVEYRLETSTHEQQLKRERFMHLQGDVDSRQQVFAFAI